MEQQKQPITVYFTNKILGTFSVPNVLKCNIYPLYISLFTKEGQDDVITNYFFKDIRTFGLAAIKKVPDMNKVFMMNVEVLTSEGKEFTVNNVLSESIKDDRFLVLSQYSEVVGDNELAVVDQYFELKDIIKTKKFNSTIIGFAKKESEEETHQNQDETQEEVGSEEFKKSVEKLEKDIRERCFA